MKVPYCIEDLGIEFSRFAAKECEVHCATWRDGDNSHIYKVEMTPHPAGWHASLSNDGRNVGGVTAESRFRCADMAMGAMRAYIVRGHRRTLRSLRRDSEAAYAELHPYALDLLDKCDSDLSLAHAVEAILLKRGIPAERMRGVDFAKSMLRSMALEMRRAYCHRGQKIRKRAIARANAKAEAGKGGAE